MIEIEHQDDDSVIFYVDDIAYQVAIETEIGSEQYPVSFNSMNDEITWAESDTIYYTVLPDTLLQDGREYSDTNLCNKLEKLLNYE